MVANILPTDTPSTQGVGSKGQTISFSESSHVAYQIKADIAGSNMVANILLTDTPLLHEKTSLRIWAVWFVPLFNNLLFGKYKSLFILSSL